MQLATAWLKRQANPERKDYPMKATLHVDLRAGHVYKVDCRSVRQARVIAQKTRYCRGKSGSWFDPEPVRTVLVSAGLVECYAGGELVSVER